MICADVSQAGAIVAAAVQPADLAGCAVVLITGQELSALTGVAFPSPADFGTVWGIGFSLVVGTFCMAWGAGAVLRMFK